MKEKQKPQEGKQPRSQAAVIHGSLVLWMVSQVFLAAQWPSFRRMAGGRVWS